MIYAVWRVTRFFTIVETRVLNAEEHLVKMSTNCFPTMQTEYQWCKPVAIEGSARVCRLPRPCCPQVYEVKATRATRNRQEMKRKK